MILRFWNQTMDYFNTLFRKTIISFIGISILWGGFLIIKTNKNISDISAFIGGMGEVEMKSLALSNEDISNITKPSVVSIYNHIEGKIIVPYFELDYKNLKITFPQNKNPPLEEPVDIYFKGSGFIINSDGYILTNAHVVSDYKLKSNVARILIGLEMISVSQDKKINKQFETAVKASGINIVDENQFLEDLTNKWVDEYVDKITSSVSKKITILNPSSTGDKLSELIDKGFSANIVSVNEDYFRDQKDFAVLKIEKSNLPSVNLGDSKIINTGNKIYVYGFPSSAQFNAKDILEPTFTQGTINGFKDSKTKSFQVFQTDAKVSSGSSGGPLLNEQGDAAGIISFASSSKELGDAFAFAIPINLVKDVLKEKNINFEESRYVKFLKSALLYYQNNRCAKAIQDFNVVKQIDSNFKIDKYIQPYMDKCSALISSGQSIDNSFDEFKVWSRNIGNLVWVLIGGGVFIIIMLIWVIAKLIKRLKRDEEGITQLENNSGNHINRDSPLTPNINPIPSPALLNYIQSARNSGTNDSIIIDELRKAGWREDDIQAAIK